MYFLIVPDLLVSKHNCLTVRKIFCLRAWLKFGKLYRGENESYCFYWTVLNLLLENVLNNMVLIKE